MTVLRTDLGNTRENAARIRFEPSAINTATNVQDAIDVVTTAATAPSPVVVAATGNITTAMVAVQTNQVGAITLTLPDSAAWAAVNGKYGVPLSIFDISGNASTNNVTIDFTGGQTASGYAALTINSDYGGFRFEPKSGGGWVVV